MKKAIPDAVLRQHTAVLGKTGSGKTSTEKLMVEQVVEEGFRVCVLDSIKSDWWGITSSANGKKAGLPFKILGGPHGHVPLHSSAGKVIGQLVGAGKLPLSIIDMADFEAGGLQRFFIDFAQSLMRNMKGVVYLVIEEAHEFAPKERAGIGAENLAIHWAKKLATAGRSKGIRLVVATQRVQSLHNAVLGSCETVIAHRLSTPADQEPVLKWLKANATKDIVADIASTMSSLPNGTAWLCSGEAKIFERVAFPKFKTYDNTATPEGDEDAIEVKTAPVDQDELRSIIGDAVKEAEANDPAKLRAENARLTRELASRTTVEIVEMPAAEVSMAEARGAQQGKFAVIDALRAASPAFDAAVRKAIDDTLGRVIRPLVDDLMAAMEKAVPAKPVAAPPARRHGPGHRPSAPVQAPRPTAALVSGRGMDGVAFTLTGAQRKVMAALAFWRGLGFEQPTRAQLAAVAGYSPTSGGFANRLGGLSTAGLITYPVPGTVAATEAGLAVEVTVPAGTVRERLGAILSQPQQKIVDALLGPMGGGGSREGLGEETGYSPTSGGFANLLGSLRTLGIIDYPRPGEVAIADWVTL